MEGKRKRVASNKKIYICGSYVFILFLLCISVVNMTISNYWQNFRSKIHWPLSHDFIFVNEHGEKGHYNYNMQKLLYKDVSSKSPISASNNNSPVTYILNDNGKCKSLKLIIAVFSAPGNLDARLAIRGTWGTASLRLDVDMIFLIGRTADESLNKKITEESNVYKDIVQEDFIDTYRNLSVKSIALLKWVNAFCNNAAFVLKVDDDNFVDIPNLVNFLENANVYGKVIFGKVRRNLKPSRNEKSKWYVSKEEFGGTKYPDFVGGSAYVISQGAIQNLLEAATTLKQFPMEDVFITGVCAQYSNVLRVNEARFRVTTDIDNPCSFRNLFATHGVPASSLFVAWWYSKSQSLDSCDFLRDIYPCIQKCKALESLMSSNKTSESN